MLSLIITLVVVGFLLWVVNTYVPMANSIKTILNVLVVVLVIIYILQFFGIIHIINI